MSEQQTSNEVYQSVNDSLRNMIMVGMEVAELSAMRRMELARKAEQSDHQERSAIKERMRAERSAAHAAMRTAWKPQWWQSASPQEIADVYQLAAGWARSGDPLAATAVEKMREELWQRHGVAAHLEPNDDVLAPLLGAAQSAAALDEPGEQFAPATGQNLRYQVRDRADGAQLAAGEVSVPAGASLQDAALAAAADYGRALSGSPAERVDQLLGVAYDYAERRRVPAGAVIEVSDGQGTIVAALAAEDLDAVADERQAWRRAVIAGQEQASPDEALAAIMLEERAARLELLEYQAGMRRAENETELGAARELADAVSDRLRDLHVRRDAAEEAVRGGDGQLVLRASVLRRDLDAGYWQTANIDEITDIWRHVHAWPDGAGRDEMVSHLRAGVGGRYGIDIPADTDPDRAVSLIREAADRAARARDEQAAAVDQLENARGLAASGRPDAALGAVETAAELAQAAAQDQAWTQALAASSDQEAAESVATAARTVSGTPAQRLTEAGTSNSRPKPDRQLGAHRGKNPELSR